MTRLQKVGVLDAGEPGGTDIPIDLVDEIVAFSKSLRRRLEHKMDATRHRTARGRALFLDVAARMAAAGPGAGALGPMAAAEPVVEALGAQHVGRRVSVFYDKPAPGASYLARLLHYDSVSDEFGVQWVNEHGGQLEGSASEWMDLGEGVALVPDSGTPTRPFLQRMQKQEDDGAFKRKWAQYDAGPTGKKIQPVRP